MSQHSSLKERGFGTRHRNVLKRFERIKKLKADDRWKPESSAFGLPKVKSMKVKVKKVKEAKAEGAAATPGAAPAAGAPAAEAKPKAGK
jgi:small basic protein (TIGR04137 family)